jgi:hypothetical protein
MLLVALGAPRPAGGQVRGAVSPDDFVVEVSAVARQDPPTSLAARRAEVVKAIEELGDDAADDAARKAERNRLAARLRGLDADIDKRSGFVVLGWSRKEGGHQSLTGFLVPSSARTHRLLTELEPGAFLHMSARGMKDLVAISGRRYYEARHVREIERPADWTSRVPAEPPPLPNPEAPSLVDATLNFQRTTETDYGERHRYELRVDAVRVGDGIEEVTVTVALRLKTPRGATIGPVPLPLRMKRFESGNMAPRVIGWDLTAFEGTPIDPQQTSMEVIDITWDDV